MEIIKDILITISLLTGLFFYFVGAVGLIRMPDAFCRMHATTKCDTLGAGLVFVAVMLYLGFTLMSINILIILIFIWFTNPTAAHYLAKIEYKRLHEKEGE